MTDTTDTSARNWATACHLASFVVLLGVPFGNLIGPLVVWLLKRGDHAFVDEHGKEAVNFQISLAIYVVLLGLVSLPVFVGGMLVDGPGLALLAVPVLIAIALLVYAVVGVIMAAIRASEGVAYRYPLTVRLIR